MNFQLKRKLKLIHRLFGGRVTEPHSHETFDIKIFNLNDTFSFSIEVFSEEKICGLIPRVFDSTTIRELKELGNEMEDFKMPHYEIVLLEADVEGHLLIGKSNKLKSGLVVIETPFVYSFTGR